MASFGQQTLEKVGRSIQVTADGAPKAKAGGITIAWSIIAAFGADYNVRATGENSTYPVDDFVYAGEKFLRYGTIMCRINGGTLDGSFAPFGTDLTTPGGTLLVTKGDVFVLNYSVHENEAGSDHLGAAIDGGRIFAKRVIVAGLNPNATAESTALGLGGAGGVMARSVFEAACPHFTYVTE